MKSGKQRIILMAVACATAACLALAGCGGSGASSSAASDSASSASASASSSAAAGKEFGTKSTTAKTIQFTNETGATITGLTALSAVAGSEPIELMGVADSWLAGEQATVYVEPVGSQPFTLTFTCNGAEHQLHSVDFTQLSKASIHLDGDVAYITSQVGGNAVSTLQQEYALAHPSQTSTQAGATAAASEDEEPEDEEVYYEETEEYYEEEYVEEGYDDSDYEEAPDQDEDSCVDDIVLN